MVNELGLSLKHGHFWGMDEWVVDGKEVPLDFPLGFARADIFARWQWKSPEKISSMSLEHTP